MVKVLLRYWERRTMDITGGFQTGTHPPNQHWFECWWEDRAMQLCSGWASSSHFSAWSYRTSTAPLLLWRPPHFGGQIYSIHVCNRPSVFFFFFFFFFLSGSGKKSNSQFVGAVSICLLFCVILGHFGGLGLLGFCCNEVFFIFFFFFFALFARERVLGFLFVFMLATFFFFFFFWSCVLKRQKAWRVQSNWFWSWLYLSSEKMRFLTSPRYGFCSCTPVCVCVCVYVCAFSFFPHSLSSFVRRIFISAQISFESKKLVRTRTREK